MELYDSFQSTERTHNEPWSYTPAYDAKDIICRGSDDEESAEELRAKRLRYEIQARRYLQGRRPLLFSASLRGPFTRESGWVNPWARPLRPQKHQHDLRISSEIQSPIGDAPAKSNGNHAFEYGNAANVLAWQAAVKETPTMSDGDNSLAHKVIEHGNLGANEASASVARSEDSIINNYTKTPRITEASGEVNTGEKRGANPEWLQGSYISKRAKWDGPIMSTPTPGPGSRSSNCGVRISSFIRFKETKIAPPAPSSTVKHPLETPMEVVRQLSIEDDMETDVLYSAQVENRKVLDILSPGRGLSSYRTSHQPHTRLEEEAELDELHDSSQGSMSVSRHSPGQPSKRRLSETVHHSFPDIGEDELLATTPHQKPMALPRLATSPFTNMKNSSLSRLPPHLFESAKSSGDTSFVSEVAPSSRDLERFHFKKKRRRTKSTAYDVSRIIDGQIDLQPEVATESTSNSKVEPTSRPTENALNVLPSVIPSPDMKHSVDGFADRQRSTAFPPHSHAATPSRNFLVRQTHRTIEGPDVENSYPYQKKTKSTKSYSSPLAGDNLKISQPPVSHHVEGATDNVLQALASGSLPAAGDVRSAPLLPSLRHETDTTWDMNDMSWLGAVLNAGVDADNKSPQRTVVPMPTESSPHMLPLEETLEEPIRKALKEQLRDDDVGQSDEITTPDSSSADEPGPQSSIHGYSSESRMQSEPPSSKQSTPLGSPSHSSLDSPPQEALQVTELPATAHSLEPQSVTRDVSQHVEAPPEPAGSRNIYDMTTQSYNTTPHRSQRTVHTQATQPSANSSNEQPIDHSIDSKGSEVQDEQNEMDRIQLELSQVCPSSLEGSSISGDDVADFGQVKDIDGEIVHVNSSLCPSDSSHRPAVSQQSDWFRLSPGSSNSEPIEQPVAQEDPTTTEVIVQQKVDEPVESLSPESFATSPEVQANDEIEEPKIKTKNHSDVDEASEDSWQGCGPQSPWANEDFEVVPAMVPAAESLLNPSADPEPEADVSALDLDLLDQRLEADLSTNWQRIERATTLENTLRPLNELGSSHERRQAEHTRLSVEFTSTQMLVEAATTNPWTSSIKKKVGSSSTKKRVSFQGLAEESQNSEPRASSKLLSSSPPPQGTPVTQEDLLDNEAAVIYRKFGRNMTVPRQHKRILQETTMSQMTCSPAPLSAQAEAFIAADREVSAEREPFTSLHKTPGKRLEPRTEFSDHASDVWKQQDENNRVGSSLLRYEESPLPGGSFDMEQALGEAGDFLGDWSVEAELKKAREGPELEKRGESNGFRRRRLFGFA